MTGSGAQVDAGPALAPSPATVLPASAQVQPTVRPAAWPRSVARGLIAADAASAVVEVSLVFAPVQVLLGPAPGLWVVLAGLLILATVAWGLMLRRLQAPLDFGLAKLPRSGEWRGGAPSSVVVQAAYVVGSRLGFVSLWLRTALLTLVAATWSVIGWVAFKLPAQGLLLVLWTAALMTPHLDAWRALLWQRACDRLLLSLVRNPSLSSVSQGPDGELRLFRASFQGRLVLFALAGSGLFGCVAVGIMIALSTLPVRGQIELWWWLPPALIVATLGWMAWLRAAVRPIERFIDAELVPQARNVPVSSSRPPELGEALRTTQRLPYTLALALWLAWTGAALFALLLARQRFALGQTGVLQLLAPIALVMLAAALYQVPYQQTALAPLWPRLTTRAPRGQKAPVALTLPLLLGVPVAVLMTLWELFLGGGKQSGQAALAGATLVFLATGGALLLLRDTMRPLRALRRRAQWLAGGEFMLPADLEVLSDGAGDPSRSLARTGNPPGQKNLGPVGREIDFEGDEVGHLAAALTAMQRALGERLLSSAHAQLFLEQQVTARTVELKRRNEELRGALQELQKAQAALLHTEHLASVGRLVAGIAHEINNPINAVVNTVAPLREALLDLGSSRLSAEATEPLHLAETLRELPAMLRVIERGARRTQQIVSALHSYSDRQPEVGEQAHVHLILAEALELVQHPVKSSVLITQKLGELPSIVGHAGQLQQVFINLLSNALYAVAQRAQSADREFQPQIELQTTADSERVQIAVRDNGFGIPSEVRLRIFDPFFTTKDASSGSGLGLSIAHSIISRHGGTIAVDDAPGSGACFTVTLPVMGRPRPP